MKKMYIDGVEIDLGGSGGGVSEEKVSEMIQEASLIEYSETPVQIGTWGNRKIYRVFVHKSFKVPSNVTDEKFAEIDIPAGSLPISITGTVFCDDYGHVLAIPSRGPGTPDAIVGINVSYFLSNGHINLIGHKLNNTFSSDLYTRLSCTVDYIEPAT